MPRDGKAFALMGATLTGARLKAPKAPDDPATLVLTVEASVDGPIVEGVQELLGRSVRVRVDTFDIQLPIEKGLG